MPTDSPEDKLLRLIKGKHKKTDIEAAPAKKIFLKNQALRGLFSDSVNRILIGILILLAGYLGYNLLFPGYKDMEYSAEKPDALGGFEAPAPAAIEDYSGYLKAIKGKDLFSAASGGEEAEAAKEPDIDLSKRFNLVGIIAGDRPQAIIEDTEASKTHYMYEGQSLNGVTVAEITEGRVVLEYKGREVMLVL